MSSAASPDSIATQLHSAAVHLLRSLRRADSAAALNAPRLSALSVIVFGGPITLGSLAHAEQVRPPTMTRIVYALQQQGLVVKQPDPNDRRNVHISATARGKRVLLAARKLRLATLAGQIARLDRKDQQTLRAAVVVLCNLLTTNS